MNTIQWIFHYFEIMKFSKQEEKVILDNLSDIQTSIQAFYLLVDKVNGPKMIDTLIDIKRKRVEFESGKPSNNPVKNKNTNNSPDDNLPDLLSDEDKELWSFMETLPETMIEGDGMKAEIKPILPTRSKQEILDSQTKVVDSIKKEEKPKLGFN